MRQRKVVAFHQGADPWLRAVLSIILIFVFRNSGCLVLLGYFLSAAILDISQGLSARRNRELATALLSPRHPQCELAYRHELFRYATPYLLAAAINSISMYGDRWTLQYLYGTGQLGIYAALCQIANAPVALGSGMIMQLMMPVIFQRAGSLESHAQRRHSRRLLFVSIAVFAIVMLAVGAAFALFGSTVIAWVSSPAFAEHHQVLWIIFVGMVMLQLGQQATIMGQIHRSIRQYLPCYFLNAVSTITVSFLLGRAYGMRGVAIGLLNSNSLYFFSVLVVNRRFTSDVIAKDERA
jgi:O-antigen/teichoic acid export membrane protein